MEINTMNLDELKEVRSEILEKRTAIATELTGDVSEERLNELEQEIQDLDKTDEMVEERNVQIQKEIETRKALEKEVIEKGTVLEARKGENTNMTNELFTVDSVEYRNAYLKQIKGIELDETEKRSLTSAANSAGAAIPTELQNRIFELVKQEAPLLTKVDLYSVAGGIDLTFEGVFNPAIKHTEGAAITASADTLVKVSLGGHEVVKLLQASHKVKAMSISAFENWIVTNVAKAVASFISNAILFGSGTGEAEGIEKITWAAGNSVTVGASASLTQENVRTLESLLPGGYDNGAIYVMSKKTFYQDFLPLQDIAKNKIVITDNGTKVIDGYEVVLDERVPLHVAYLGNFFEGYKANLVEDVQVKHAYDINSNTYKYLGVAIFDGKVARQDAFVKLVKGA